MVSTFGTSAATLDWFANLAVVADIAVVIVAVTSLWVAMSALRHQRNHDNKVIGHEQRAAEPDVSWSFGMDSDERLLIGLSNNGPGAARFIRSTLIVDSQEVSRWNWSMVWNAIGKGAVLDIHDPRITMPKLIPGGATVQLMAISSDGITGGELLRRLIESIEIRYYYRSNLNDDELYTQWTTAEEIGFRD